MSTTLEITFRCLCFFVPDENTNRVHVLMPATTNGCCGTKEPADGEGRRTDGRTEGAHATHVDPHVARVVFPLAGGRLNSAGDAKVRDRQKNGKMDFLEMEGWSLVLPGTGAGASTRLDEKIVDLSEVTGLTVSRDLFSGAHHPRLASLITLDGGGIKEALAGANWDFDGKTGIPIAQQVTWKVEGLPDGPLAWSRRRLKPAGEAPAEGDDEELPPLQPNKRGQIKLRVHHVMERDFPRAKVLRTPDVSAAHFVAHYGIFGDVDDKPLPVFRDNREETNTIDCLATSGKPKWP